MLGEFDSWGNSMPGEFDAGGIKFLGELNSRGIRCLGELNSGGIRCGGIRFRGIECSSRFVALLNIPKPFFTLFGPF